jgi:Flp pilus assembly protein TadB
LDLFLIVFLAFFAIVVFIALFAGRNPVITDFEARQRGLQAPDQSEEKRRQARARSDSTMRTAFGVFGVIAGLLLAIALLVHLYYAEFTYLTAPIFVGIGVLLLFFMMWYDEERIKARHGEIRIER